MPTYGVEMGQAITVANLGANTLVTGYGEVEDRLQSCAAVILCNTTTGAAGLYHYPSGNLSERPTARNLLTAMRDAVQPNEAYIVYGIVNFLSMGQDAPVPSDPFNMVLRDYVLRLLPLQSRLRRLPATTGYATVSLNAGRFTVGTALPVGITDLRATAAGPQAFGVLYNDGL